MKSLITLIVAIGMGVSFSANAELKRGTIVGAYRLLDPSSQKFNILVEAVANPKYSNQRLFYFAEERNNKIVRKGQEFEAQVNHKNHGKYATLYMRESDAFPVAKLDVSRAGNGHIRGKMDDEAFDLRITVMQNCRQLLEINN